MSVAQGNTNKQDVRVSEKKAQSSGLTAVETKPEELTGKCSYPACPIEEDSKTSMFITVKNTDYKFHSDCYGKWSQENRGMGRFSHEDRVEALDEQSGKTKEEPKK